MYHIHIILSARSEGEKLNTKPGKWPQNGVSDNRIEAIRRAGNRISRDFPEPREGVVKKNEESEEAGAGGGPARVEVRYWFNSNNYTQEDLKEWVDDIGQSFAWYMATISDVDDDGTFTEYSNKRILSTDGIIPNNYPYDIPSPGRE